MDVVKRIKQLADDRGWTEYRLVKESGLSASTIANIYHRGTIPSVPTIEILCAAFGISMPQFFDDKTHHSLSREQAALLNHFSALSAEQRKIILNLLNSMHN